MKNHILKIRIVAVLIILLGIISTVIMRGGLVWLFLVIACSALIFKRAKKLETDFENGKFEVIKAKVIKINTESKIGNISSVATNNLSVTIMTEKRKTIRINTIRREFLHRVMNDEHLCKNGTYLFYFRPDESHELNYSQRFFGFDPLPEDEEGIKNMPEEQQDDAEDYSEEL